MEVRTTSGVNISGAQRPMVASGRTAHIFQIKYLSPGLLADFTHKIILSSK
jgi:hypothetical protein